MIEFTCPHCGHEVKLNHSDIDYACDYDVEVWCTKCEGNIIVDIEGIPVVFNVRKKEKR